MSKLIEKIEDEKEVVEKSYTAEGEELAVLNLVQDRIKKMDDFQKSVMGKNIQEIWKDADKEYQPDELKMSGHGKRFESDDELGLRARLVPILGEEQLWRSKNSDPMLFTKIQSALSILIDKDPEAFFTALTKKYEATTKLAYSLWKTSWTMDQSKQQLKLFIFNLAKYGWAAGRTYPKIVKRKKMILTEIDTEHPDKNKYTEQEIVDYNGVHRENLDIFKVKIDEMTRPNEPLSTNDWYFEKDYSIDSAGLEFSGYTNWKYALGGATKLENEDDSKNERKDIITIGFYENKLKDLYAIYVPSKQLVLAYSPLPNDEGQLSLWHTYWALRDARIPFGIGLWEIIRNDKHLYDRMQNMTMDQLVLAIYKMFFMSGTSNLLTGDGTIKIEPGKGIQNLGGKVEWLEVPGPGKESWEGLKYQKSKIDDASGVAPVIEGEITGKTLGEILHAKEAALKRMNLPLGNIAEALENEAYISLSWLAQILSIPEVKDFADENELRAYEQESGLNMFSMIPQIDQEGMQTGVQGVFYPQVPLNVDFDANKQLIESKETRFFQIENELPASKLKWRGIIKVEPRSILTPSIELDKQRKSELFNIIVPLLSQPPEIFLKAVEQILKINDEDIEDWLPDIWLQYKETGRGMMNQQPLFVPAQGFGETMQGQQGMQPQQPQTVVPKSQAAAPQQMNALGKLKQTFGAMFKQ